MADNFLEKRYAELFSGSVDPETGYTIERRSRKNVPAPLPEGENINTAALRRNIEKGSTDLVVVLGPTASGKTKYAVQLAHELGRCEIISADSRQVYRRMDIGTGKDLADYGDVPYHLIDIAEPGETYNVYRFQQDFIAAYADIRSRGAIPILCGGTGLYISAVTSGYDFRNKKPLSAAREDAAAGVSCAGAAGEMATNSLPRNPYFIGTLVSREERNARIDKRLDERLQQGMIEEIRGLLAEGVSAQKLISYGLEYKFVTQYVTGELEYSRMRELLSTAIHQFAKRQMTWWRGMERSGIRIHWIRIFASHS